MGNRKSTLPEKTDDLTCRWCNKLFTDPVTLGCGHSLCRTCLDRVRDREKKPRCQYKYCGKKIRDIPYVNWTLDKMAERAKKLKNISMDELDEDSKVNEICITISCSIANMDPPPDRRPAGTSESGLVFSETTEMCDARESCVSVNAQHEGSVHTANGTLDKKNTEARGSVPVSSSSSNGDSGCKETQSGDSGRHLCTDTRRYGLPYVTPPATVEIWPDFSKDLSDVDSVGNSNTSLDELGGDSEVEGSSVPSSCSIASLFLPPDMGPARISDVELFSNKTASSDVYSVGDTGGEEFKHPAQAEPPRVTVVTPDRYHFLITSILSLSERSPAVISGYFPNTPKCCTGDHCCIMPAL